MKKLLPIVMLTGCLLLAGRSAQACPNCKEMLSENSPPSAATDPATPMATLNQPGSGDWGQGFYWSIMVMMSAPFLMAGGFGAFLWMHTRRPQALPPQTR